MAVSERDRPHFDAIARTVAMQKAEQRAEALRTTIAERIATGFVLGAVPCDEATELAREQRALGQIGLALRGLAHRS
jgi:hypothetical protein